jgi:hypothetical protein
MVHIDQDGHRTECNQTMRNVFVIGPDKAVSGAVSFTKGFNPHGFDVSVSGHIDEGATIDKGRQQRPSRCPGLDAKRMSDSPFDVGRTASRPYRPYCRFGTYRSPSWRARRSKRLPDS